MTKTKKIIIVAGEESGDMYAANIIKNFSKRKEIIFYGMGSSKVKETNIEILVDSSELSVLGLIEIIKMYPRLLYALRTMKKSISSIRPDLSTTAILLISFSSDSISKTAIKMNNGKINGVSNVPKIKDFF